MTTDREQAYYPPAQGFPGATQESHLPRTEARVLRDLAYMLESRERATRYCVLQEAAITVNCAVFANKGATANAIIDHALDAALRQHWQRICDDTIKSAIDAIDERIAKLRSELDAYGAF